MMKLIRPMLGVILLALPMFACGGSSVEGTYSDANGSAMVELKAGGKASFTYGNMVTPCSYTSTDKDVTLNCENGGGTIAFTRHDDGSLSGPAGGALPILKKTK